MALLSPARLIEGFNANQNAALRPRLQTKKMRKGIVIEVNEHYGRILCSRSFSDPGVFVFFTPDTQINGASMNTFFQSLPATVPVGAEVEFRLTYAFPSKWRTFGTYMGYFCQAMNFDVSKRIPKNQEKLVVKEHRQHGLVVATNNANDKFIIHPQIWPSLSIIRKLYSGKELEPKLNHRFQILTQQGRTLLAEILPMPSFLKSKLRHMDHLVISAQPLSTTVVLYGAVQGGGRNEIFFDSVGIRNDTGDNESVTIVMDKQLFVSSIGRQKTKLSKVNPCKMIGEIYQLGCVLNIPTGVPGLKLRAFCAYEVKDMPRNPTVQLPKEYATNARKHKTSTRIKPLARPQTPRPRQRMMDEEELPMDLMNTSFVRKDSMKMNASFTRRSMNRKYAVRKSFQTTNSRKRAYNPCSPFTDLTANKKFLDDSDLIVKKKNLEDSFQNFTLSDN